MAQQTPPDEEGGRSPERLDSWKDIAGYLKRDVSTVQRWEKREGMPVHRHLHGRLGSVYAFAAELDAWWDGRRTQPSAAAPSEPRKRRALWTTLAAGALSAIVAVVLVTARARHTNNNPLVEARFTRLTDFDGSERAAAISRDGKFVAFLSDRDGADDVWVTQIGTGQFHNLTRGRLRDLSNADVRTIGFSPDATLVTIWMRRGLKLIDIWAIPTLGGEPHLYLEHAAEYDWSSDAKRLVYHTPGAGDPMFVRDDNHQTERKLYTAPAGLHTHFPVWSPDDRFIYVVHGGVPDKMDIWRLASSGGALERMTNHNSRVTHPVFADSRTLLYLASDADGSGPWLHALAVDEKKSHRIGVGAERYTSLSSSADGKRLVVATSHSHRTFWRIPIGGEPANESAATRIPVTAAGARSPRAAAGSLIFVSSASAGESIWKRVGSEATEIWKSRGARLTGAPAISADGRRIAFCAADKLYVMNADGSSARAVAPEIRPLSAPAWSADGKMLAVAATIQGAPWLVRVSPDTNTVMRVVAGVAADPAWSPDGASILYSGPDIGTALELRSVSASGGSPSQPLVTLSRGARRVVFLPGQQALVILRGEMDRNNFSLVDLRTGRERALTAFGPSVEIADFDVSADGREIVFDRRQDNSDLVVIDR